MDELYLKKINKALVVLSNPTNLFIAKKLDSGILSCAVLARLLHGKELNEKVSHSEYTRTIEHIWKLKAAGVINPISQDFSKFKDYELTQIGREALERKGYRNLILNHR